MTKKYVISEEELKELNNIADSGELPRGNIRVWVNTIKSKKPIEIADLEDAIGEAINDNSEVAGTDDFMFLSEDNMDKTIKEAIQNIKDKLELGG